MPFIPPPTATTILEQYGCHQKTVDMSRDRNENHRVRLSENKRRCEDEDENEDESDVVNIQPPKKRAGNSRAN